MPKKEGAVAKSKKAAKLKALQPVTLKLNKRNWCLYIIEAENGALYTGITNDLKKRIEKHQKGQGAKFFRTTKPLRVVYTKKRISHSRALKLEYSIKQLSRPEKEALIRTTSQVPLEIASL